MVSFGVIFFFLNVELDRTIDKTLKRIYKKNEIVTSIAKKEMMEMLIIVYEKCSSYLWIQNICTNRSRTQGFISEIGFRGHFYDQTSKFSCT